MLISESVLILKVWGCVWWGMGHFYNYLDVDMRHIYSTATKRKIEPCVERRSSRKKWKQNVVQSCQSLGIFTTGNHSQSQTSKLTITDRLGSTEFQTILFWMIFCPRLDYAAWGLQIQNQRIETAREIRRLAGDLSKKTGQICWKSWEKKVNHWPMALAGFTWPGNLYSSLSFCQV